MFDINNYIMMNTRISKLKILCIFFLFTYLHSNYAQVKLELEMKISDKGLYFDGKKRSSSTLNTNEPGFDYFFGTRITPHGDCIEKFGDYLFLTWWEGGESSKQVMLSRLNIKTQVLETVRFPHIHVGYQHKYPHIGDSHNTIAVGICPLDSTVHLLYDMHSYSKTSYPDDYFNYNISLKGAAGVPDGEFTIDLFKPRQTYLNNNYNYSDITYPNFFINTKNELFVWFREGGNNNGMFKFAKYDGNSWGAFTNFSTLNAKNSGSAYNWGLYGDLKFVAGKFRVGFLKRMSYNNDKYVYNNGFHYAYSDDPEGKTMWYNYKNEPVSLPVIKPESIFFYEPGDIVTNGGANTVYMSSGADWTVTDSGSVHFITRVKSLVDNVTKNVHAFKKAGDEAFTISTNFPGGTLYAVDGDRVFLMGLNNSKKPYIYSTEGGTNNWTKLYEASSGKNFRHTSVLLADKKLFLYLMESKSGSAQPIYLQMYDLGLSDDPATSIASAFSDEKHYKSSVFPNPTTDILNITVDTNKETPYALYNLTGSIILQGTMYKNTTISLSGLSKGIYYLRLTSPDIDEQHKILVQ